MDEPYLPKSDFIWMAANDEVPLTGSDAADHNFRLLIAFMRDADVSNRDWATMTVAMQEIDTPEVREALLAATEDSDAAVRAEALEGLAQRDKELALPLVERELRRDECAYGTFKAALLLAHPSLLDGLRTWAGQGGASWIDAEISDAIAACAAAQPYEE
jgi:HEAT repeat protein